MVPANRIGASTITEVLSSRHQSFFTSSSEDEAFYRSGEAAVAVSAANALTVTDALATEWIEFQRLVNRWKTERGAASSITEGAMCPAYQSIIGMGPAAVPFLLLQLQIEGDEPDQWFWALTAITRANPVAEEDRGDYVKMAADWLNWGRQQGYAW